MMLRMAIDIRGAVQGVGFRPFIYRLACERALHGWVINTPEGVSMELEGEEAVLREMPLRIRDGLPPLARIHGMQQCFLDPAGYDAFEIRASANDGAPIAPILPDIATCDDCLRDIFDPGNRRHRYPFTNCTHCGPRYSIILALPYDRDATTMRRFTMCPACRAEYDDPADRRFHAQPNACPECGPRLTLLDRDGATLAIKDDALSLAAGVLSRGGIVAVKGIGGFHLLVDASDDNAVAELRRRKRREEKPLALMFPDMRAVEAVCQVSDEERAMLISPEAPIVLLRRRDGATTIAHAVAPGNPWLGIMLPYTPLHHLLLDALRRPLVATSGNLTDEPICTENAEALERLRGIADVFLVHDRPIARHVDDSISRLMCGRPMLLRRARGYAPLPIELDAGERTPPLLAVGGHVKNTVAFRIGANVMISQHIGDLDTMPSRRAFASAIGTFESIYRVHPEHLVVDAHPDYHSTRYALGRSERVTSIQHHVAHVASCMAENRLDGEVLGFAWDGTGYGDDGTIWGSESFLTDGAGYSRVASLRPFLLPGGEAAIHEPWRVAISVLYHMHGAAVAGYRWLAPVLSTPPHDMQAIIRMLERRVNAPVSSSMGRVFDAVASLLGIRHVVRFEGQAAMELEFAADPHIDATYPVAFVQRIRATAEPNPGSAATRNHAAMTVLDWEPMFTAMLTDLRDGVPVPVIAARFHNALVDAIVGIAQRNGNPRVVLSGGCFQNVLLTERAVRRLSDAGFSVYRHQRVPPNDGGLALGQIFAASKLAASDRERAHLPALSRDDEQCG
jgi:hydrogenase maturation protein HypF